MTDTPHTAYQLAAIARPGDTVIIAFHGNLTDDDIQALDESFQPLIDRGIQVAFTDQVSSIIIARPDEDIDDWGGE